MIDYFQTHAAGISALIAVLGIIWAILWPTFQLAAEQVTKKRFDSIDQRFSTVDTQLALLKQNQEQILEGQKQLLRIYGQEKIAP